MEINQGNISTIGVMIWTILSPYIAQYITQEVFIAIFGLIIVIWSAYNPNTMRIFNNQTDPVTTNNEPEILNDKYVTGDDDGTA